MLYFSQVKLHFTESALRLIARKAISKNTGARGLRAILENILMDAMYEVLPLLLSLAFLTWYTKCKRNFLLVVCMPSTLEAKKSERSILPLFGATLHL